MAQKQEMKVKLSGIAEIMELFPEGVSEITAKYRIKAYYMHSSKLVILKIIGILSPVIGAFAAIVEIFVK